ncbi:PDDEXK nuclease domain-containing protein [Enterocloster clostridioformis]|uniref:PDDEXK nuclease domain-containing protein n=1 Tax=Enterocloster clostridioformis TaxID=1531 RepID=UPI0008E1A736|nr:PDDEXK nuclease domain-containing protein [Enterocloster clostridioformis]SFG47146.1 Predicted nuclease of restriction endonuclease-like (RecB) superfamily, DUF1016 family [Enterocloster clostridioformis]
MKNKNSNAPIIVRSHDVHLDSDYVQWVHDIKERFRNTQIKAAIKVNSEQLLFNWQLGRDLAVRKVEEKWGNGIVEQLSLDLRNEFPDIKGFSTTNLWYMKKWYTFYAGDNAEKLQRLVGEMETQISVIQPRMEQIGKNVVEEKLQQVIGEFLFPAIFAYVPWGHHIDIITKCDSIEEALFYIYRTIEEGWSRSTLQNCIKSGLYGRTGTAITNFSERLPTIQGKLAQEITKDTYDLGFITLPPDYDEIALEDALEQNITRFLLELGTGFAFIGRQKEIVVSGKARKIDMLFYHIRLKCYVVVELKAVSFEPEFAGKLNFYVNAVNELIRTPDENPTIGLLICKDKDQTEVQWAFQGIQTPMGVASYDNIKLEEIKKQLPTEEQIQQRIELAEEEFNLSRQRQQ